MKNAFKRAHRKLSRRGTTLLACVCILLLALLLVALDSRLVVRRYEIDTHQLTTPVRIALITDLHSCKYGEEQHNLIDSLRSLAPDLVLLGGDIFDDKIADTNTELFLAGIANDYPCYYVTGNHEYWSGAKNFERKMQILQTYDITVLSGTSEVVTIHGNALNLCGVDDPDAYMVRSDLETDPQGYERARTSKSLTFTQQLQAVSDIAENGNYTILLSHRPELFDSYTKHSFDLVLCGHAHGGQWRIPGLLNGLYAPNQGLFPDYAGGRYEENGTTMIVSRGLARESTLIPRIFNRPELVLIELR